MRYIVIMMLLAGMAGAPLLAQEEQGDAKQAEKKEAIELNVYEATFTGMT